MFEHTLIKTEGSDKNRYTVLFSLLLQVAALGILIIAALIYYTQVLPKAQLRSIFAAPTPPLPAAPRSVRNGRFNEYRRYQTAGSSRGVGS